ncbi:MAG TPA: hydrogenase maturation protease [Thermodesulfobacteriota bacterium]|nr:hydrogenase maturation protease [Thermodesulfobacteriota bacterium]
MDLNRMLRTLVIGFGNIDRADDGVAFFVVKALRRRLGQKALNEDETGLEELGAEIDSVFLSQLTPELLETLAGYQQIIFVDAHVYENVDALHCEPVSPEYTPSTFTHHLTPAAFLALLKALYHQEPTGHLVSLRGYDFDFHRRISAETEALVEPAVKYILQLVQDR